MKNDRVLKSVMTALFAALTCVATLVVHIPIPAVQGYVNIGDGVVLLGAFLLGPGWGAGAAALGSALADLLLGYAVYAPGTALIKGLCALIAALIFRAVRDKIKASALLAGTAGELVMVAGYFLYESLVLGYGAAALGSVPANAAQGAAGVAVGALLCRALLAVPSIRRFSNSQKKES